MLQIYQNLSKVHLNSKMYCKPSVTVLMLIKGMSVIFQQNLKQVLLKHCDFIVSSLAVVAMGSNETVYPEAKCSLAAIVGFQHKL